MSLVSVINDNKVALFLLVLVLVGLLTFMVFSLVADPLGMEIAQHCVTSGGVCSGGG